MLFESESHLAYYEYVLGTRDPERVRARLGLRSRPSAPPSEPRRWLCAFPECRDLSDFISSARSRLSRSLDALRRNSFCLRSLLSPPAHEPVKKRPITRSVEVCPPALTTAITQDNKALVSHDTTSEYVKESPTPTNVLAAVIDTTPEKPTSTKSTDSAAHVEQEETKFTRVHEVLRLSPYKENLRKCTAVSSGAKLSDLPACQSSAKMIDDLTDRHPSPPSPAPYDPSQPRHCFCVEDDQEITILETGNQIVTYAEVYDRPTVTKKRNTSAVTVSSDQVRHHTIVDPIDKIEPAEPNEEQEEPKGETGYKEQFIENITLSNVTYLRELPGFLQLRYNKIVADISILLDYTPRIYKNLDKFKTYRADVLETQFESRSATSVLRGSDFDDDWANDLDYSIHLPVGKVSQLKEHERKVIITFCHLFEKSKQMFYRLREVPSYGITQWCSYFEQSFDVYTQLWRYQQEHRALLDHKYGLKRSQIGEIASDIGQLYYHLYLHTSEAAYLEEAFFFYWAIRDRGYYGKAGKEEKYELMVNKLIYYARFIVVCLLWKKFKLVRDLLNDINAQIIAYDTTYNTDNKVEWNVIVDEVKAFILAEPVVSVSRPDQRPVTLSHRLTPWSGVRPGGAARHDFYLAEVVIAGGDAAQARIAGLTIDMYRVLQAVEYEPAPRAALSPRSSPAPPDGTGLPAWRACSRVPGASDGGAGERCRSPHKRVLFAPGPSQLMEHMSRACDELPPHGVLMLYMSGGVREASHGDETSSEDDSTSSVFVEGCRLRPEDLHVYTRWPLLVVADCEGAGAFRNIPRLFGQPLVVLMSSVDTPLLLNASTAEGRAQGRLLTLFLYSPLEAFCYVCGVRALPLGPWRAAQALVDRFMAEAVHLLARLRVDRSYSSFLADEFLRTLVARFVFCAAVLRLHRAAGAHPRAAPPLPEELLGHPALARLVMELSGHLQVHAFLRNPF